MNKRKASGIIIAAILIILIPLSIALIVSGHVLRSKRSSLDHRFVPNESGTGYKDSSAMNITEPVMSQCTVVKNNVRCYSVYWEEDGTLIEYCRAIVSYIFDNHKGTVRNMTEIATQSFFTQDSFYAHYEDKSVVPCYTDLYRPYLVSFFAYQYTAPNKRNTAYRDLIIPGWIIFGLNVLIIAIVLPLYPSEIYSCFKWLPKRTFKLFTCYYCKHATCPPDWMKIRRRRNDPSPSLPNIVHTHHTSTSSNHTDLRSYDEDKGTTATVTVTTKHYSLPTQSTDATVVDYVSVADIANREFEAEETKLDSQEASTTAAIATIESTNPIDGVSSTTTTTIDSPYFNTTTAISNNNYYYSGFTTTNPYSDNFSLFSNPTFGNDNNYDNSYLYTSTDTHNRDGSAPSITSDNPYLNTSNDYYNGANLFGNFNFTNDNPQ